MPIKHPIPRQRFKPPYRPAISLYPISEAIFKPTASKKEGKSISRAPKTGSNIAQIPIGR